jgi:hypothetical protein
VLERWVCRRFWLFNNCCRVSMFVNFDVRYFLPSRAPSCCFYLSYLVPKLLAETTCLTIRPACHVLLLSISPLSAQSKCLAPRDVVLLCHMEQDCSKIIWLVLCFQMFAIY